VNKPLDPVLTHWFPSTGGPVPCFFFCTYDGDLFTPDNEGLELDDIKELPITAACPEPLSALTRT
jgi:hypothetical protein